MPHQLSPRDPISGIPAGRIELLDLARGLALIAMAVFHFAWDLEFFGYAEPGMTREFGWRLFARSIAASFLFLVGFSLFLAHARGIRWPAFRKRFLQIAGGAALITAATITATPETFIFFGILHHIALASLLGLAFLHLRGDLLLLLAATALLAPRLLQAEWFDMPALWWVGLSTQDPPSNDYVPLLPWFAATLAGIAAARLASRTGLLRRLQPVAAPRAARSVVLFGRHGLAFYLLHQPLLIGALWLYAQLSPAGTPSMNLVQACVSSCGEGRDAQFCQAYCVCVLEGLEQAGLLDAMLAARSDEDIMLREGAPIAAACLAASESIEGETP